MVTGATYLKAPHFRTAERLDVLQRGLLKLAADTGWRLEAWAVFANHYHFIGHSPDTAPGAESLQVELFEEQDVPWEEMAFRPVSMSLRHYFADRNSGNFRLHIGDIVAPLQR